MKALKIAFLDRDGVINQKPHQDERVTNYVTSADLFKFNPGIFETLGNLSQKGYRFVVVTNQRGIARGLMTEGDLASIHEHMKTGLRERGIEILDIFYCPHGDKDACVCRKPKPGMLAEATKKYNIDLAKSVLISDSMHDVEMGEKFGVGKNLFIEKDKPEEILVRYSL